MVTTTRAGLGVTLIGWSGPGSLIGRVVMVQVPSDDPDRCRSAGPGGGRGRPVFHPDPVGDKRYKAFANPARYRNTAGNACSALQQRYTGPKIMPQKLATAVLWQSLCLLCVLLCAP